MPDEPTPFERKKLVRDTLVTMYLEQSTLSRHQETQRSTITTIFVSLAGAVLALIGTLWKTNGQLDRSLLPLTLTLFALGFVGLIITLKLFERSMMHFSLSEAYLNTIDVLIGEDVEELLKERVMDLRYIKEACGEEGFDFNPLTGWKTKTYKFVESGPSDSTSDDKTDDKTEVVALKEHNPVNPRNIAIPRHNKEAKFLLFRFARLSLYVLWEVIYVLMMLAGAGLSLYAFFHPKLG